MGALRDPQQEKFCRELVEQYLKIPPTKQPKLEAYKAAGYAPHKGNATRLAKDPSVAARVTELLDEYREYLDIRPIKALVRVERVAEAKLPDYFEEDGRTLKNITMLPPHLKEALASIEWDDEGRPKIKLHDKNQANFALIKHFGGMPEPERNDVNIFNVLSVDDQLVLADFIEALATRSRSSGGGVANEPGPKGKAA